MSGTAFFSRIGDGAVDLRGLVSQGADGLLTCAVALIAAGGLLVSCAEPGPAPSPDVNAPRMAAGSAGATQVAAAAPRPVPPVPRPKPKPPVAVPAAPSVQPAAVATLAPPPVPVPDFDPNRLVGLTEQETLRLLGQPAWTEENPPAKTWRYSSRGCVLRVFFFMEMTSRDFRSLSYELTSTDNEQHVDQQCLSQFLAQAAGER
ncbi:MAG TPA: hypothetical protein VEB20_22290 [Azospirillaceae bacterium]|nr:hypothetical protein [Azospirillaceae bacterium]